MPRKTENKISLTAARIKRLPLPKPKRGKGHTRTYYYDSMQPGLALVVTSKGLKGFYVVKGIHGRPWRYSLGRNPDMTVSEARRQTVEVLGQLARGVDPLAARKAIRTIARGVPTFQQAWEQYSDQHLKVNCSPRTVKNDGYLFDCLPWANRRLDTISSDNVAALHTKLTKDRGPTMANRVVEFLQRLYNYAIDVMKYGGTNPVQVTKRAKTRRRPGAQFIILNREKSRQRYLTREELPAFFQTLNAHENQDFRDLICLLLFTGARRNNVQAMQWQEIDWDRPEWVIPRTKNGDPQPVALSPFALEVLKRRRDRQNPQNSSPWIFPTTRSASGHIEEPKKLWIDLVKRAGLSNLHMHDLRRSLATWQRTTGASIEMIAAVLGHRTRAVTEIYARIDAEPVMKSITAATTAMLDAAKLPVLPGRTADAL